MSTRHDIFQQYDPSYFKPFRKPWAVGLAKSFNLMSLPRHADQILIAAGVYQTIFSIAPHLSKRLVPDTYAKLDERSQTRWNLRVVAFTQAIFICAKALNVIMTDPSRRTATVLDRLWGYSTRAGEVQAYAAGYFLWDIYASLRYYDMMGPGSLAHAVCALLVTMVGFRPFGNYYGVNFVLYELSTPFLHIHWVLDKIGKTGSKLQLANGIALMTAFFGCRLIWGTYQTYLLTNDMLAAWQKGPVPPTLFSIYLLANTTLTGLNFYWFGKMVQALQKRFQPKRAED